MSKLYILKAPCAWGTTASMAANASQTSGSICCAGYGRIVGTAWMSSSGTAACGVMVLHSSDGGANFDAYDLSALTTDSGSKFSYELVGDAVEIRLHAGATDCASVRAKFRFLPIGSAA